MPNFKVFTADNAPHVAVTSSGRPFISITVKGSFHLSSRAAQILKVKEGSNVLEARGSGKKRILCFHSSTLADTIATSTFKSQYSRVRFYATLHQPGVLQLNVKQPKVTPPHSFQSLQK